MWKCTNLIKDKGSSWNELGYQVYGDAQTGIFGNRRSIQQHRRVEGWTGANFRLETPTSGTTSIKRWVQLGQTVAQGESYYDFVAQTVTLSQNGSRVAVGAWDSLEVHDSDGNEWVQYDGGDGEYYTSVESVAMSADESKVAFKYYDEDEDSLFVRTFSDTIENEDPDGDTSTSLQQWYVKKLYTIQTSNVIIFRSLCNASHTISNEN